MIGAAKGGKVQKQKLKKSKSVLLSPLIRQVDRKEKTEEER
jgi:hypothetical protein